MRKILLWIVLLGGCMLNLRTGATAQDKETVRVFGSLEEALYNSGDTNHNSERPVLLVFFSLACHVCWDELFEMRYFLEKNSIPVDLVGICREREEELRQFLSKYKFFHPVVCDRQKALFRRFKVGLEPFFVVLHRGAVIHEDDTSRDLFVRRDEVKRWLVEIAAR
jgi:peroxiredoxin